MVKNYSAIRAADAFGDTLTNLSNSNLSRGAEESFIDIQNAIRKDKIRIDDEIQSMNASIRRFQNEIAYLRQRLNSLT
ncbi:MAG: hypothetical protein FWE41_07940 [Coriobacteriia bacterium]|nr:hypothetical protein [Coriobacteriia bacterium]MCL2750578.1 hypothetical protein [Coriobacteriia bacterium]